MTGHELPVCGHCHAPQTRHQARFCRSCGVPLHTGSPIPTDPVEDAFPPSEPEEPRKRSPWRRRLLVAGTVVAALTLTVGGLRTFQSVTTDPTDPVQELLDDLADGHGEALLDHAEIDSLLVLDWALEQGYTPPQNLRTTEVTYGDDDTDTQRPDRGSATVHVEYDLDGTTHTAHVRVTREDTGWVRDWEITSLGTLLGALVVTSDHLDEVRVAGAEIDTASPEAETHTTTAVPALPGTYELATTDEETLFAGEEPLGEVTVLGPSASPTTVAELTAQDLTVREGLADEVAEQVEAHLDECAQAETLAPPGCALGVESTPTRSTDEVSWEILQMPGIDLVASDEEALHGDPLEVETATPGTAEAEWSYSYPDDEEPQKETVEITVAGTVAVDEDGEPSWTP